MIASVYPHTASKYLEKTWTHLTLKPLKYQNEKYEYRAVEEINWLSVEDDPALMRVKAVITGEISSAQIYHSPHTQLQSLTVHNPDSTRMEQMLLSTVVMRSSEQTYSTAHYITMPMKSFRVELKLS